MYSENPLSNLRDIHMPPEISYWPPAPGWWILLFLFFLIIILTSIWFWRRYHSSKPKNEALMILNDIQNKFYQNFDNSEALKGLSLLMRRTALTFYYREEVASLQGFEWLKFLDKSGDTTDFTDGIGCIFGNEKYKKNPKINTESLFSIVKKWINVITKNTKKL